LLSILQTKVKQFAKSLFIPSDIIVILLNSRWTVF